MAMNYYFETGSVEPAWNLAFEEYIFTHFTAGNILILWQNDRSVIIGRNQNTAQEIDAAFVEAHGIRVIRRNTGGGAVYHDLGNLNYSFITDEGVSKAAFTEPVVRVLQDLGLDACASGRNDILVSGKKVSGTAQQVKNGRVLHHGTLLFDSDSRMLSGALTPDPDKFRSKGIKSVPSRVGNIRSFLPQDMDMAHFWDCIKQGLSGESTAAPTISQAELAEIEALRREKYDTWQWNYGNSPAFDRKAKKRFDRGTLEIGLTVKNGCIAQIKIYGDFLGLRPVSDLETALTGCAYRKDALARALGCLDVPAHLGGITAEECIRTLLYE